MPYPTTYVFVPFRLVPDQRLLTVDDKEYVQPVSVEIDPNLPKDAVSIEGWVEDDDEEEEMPVRKDR